MIGWWSESKCPGGERARPKCLPQGKAGGRGRVKASVLGRQLRVKHQCMAESLNVGDFVRLGGKHQEERTDSGHHPNDTWKQGTWH